MAHRGQQVGATNPNWKGGRSVASNGYVLIKVGKDHHLADVRGYAYEHRLVAEEMLGRRLRAGEVPHHKNGVKTDNRPENLDVVTRAEHGVEHRRGGKAKRLPGEPNPLVACACGCGQMFERYDAMHRERRFIPGHNAPQRSPMIDAVLMALRGGPVHRGSIAEQAGSTETAVANCLSKLRKRGVVEPLGDGVWSLRRAG